MSHKIIKHIAIWLVATVSLVFTACGKHDEPKPPTASRTVLVYQVANNNLSTYAAEDIREMLIGSKIAGAIPANAHLLVYSSNPDGITLSEIKNGTQTVLKTYAATPLSVTSERMREVYNDMQHLAPANDYGLILWSHGTGWLQNGIDDPADSTGQRSFGSESGGKCMNVTTLAHVLEDENFSFIYFDCCFMMSVETLYEMRNTAPVIAGSVTELPVDGMPYHLNLSSFFRQGSADLIQAAKNTFEYFNSKSSPIDRTCTMSVIDTQYLGDLGRLCAEIYTKASTSYPADFVPQRFSTNVNSFPFYDFGQYITALCIDADGNERFEGAKNLHNDFTKLMNGCVVYAANTDKIWNSISLQHHSGMSTYLLKREADIFKYNYNTLSWYFDVASKLSLN